MIGTTRADGSGDKRRWDAGLVILLVGTVWGVACRSSAPSAAPSSPTPSPPVAMPPAPSRAPVVGPRLSLAAQVGQRLFFDQALSASGAMSCATCHDPRHAYGPPDERAVQLGGPRRRSPGLRAVPSLRYKEYTRGYSDLLDNPDGFSDPGPGGGFAWDGRADSLAEQAGMPLLSPFEMANTSAADVVAKVRASSYAALFVQAFGAGSLDSVTDDDKNQAAFASIGLALQAFQLEDPSFHPYNSKFDLHSYGKPGGAFSAAEERGLKVFSNAKGANCASCHLPDPSQDDGAPALFTDLSFEAIGVPRNREIPANRDRRYTDQGVCGPLRRDHLRAEKFCGLFKTPTLRNAATRRAFFHNGVIHTLEQAIRFYNTRDTMPQLWYPTVGGRARPRPDPDFPRYGLITTQYVGGVVRKFDDLPAIHRANIDDQLPLDGRAAGTRPPLTEQDIADLLSFLETLTDDYQPAPLVREP
jgi:cytochrome c peroxidase